MISYSDSCADIGLVAVLIIASLGARDCSPSSMFSFSTEIFGFRPRFLGAPFAGAVDRGLLSGGVSVCDGSAISSVRFGRPLLFGAAVAGVSAATGSAVGATLFLGRPRTRPVLSGAGAGVNSSSSSSSSGTSGEGVLFSSLSDSSTTGALRRVVRAGGRDAAGAIAASLV